MSAKAELITKALTTPLDFTAADFDSLVDVNRTDKLEFTDIRFMIKEIYDMNETGLQNASDATQGTLGKLNKSDTEERLNEFKYRIRKFHDRGKTPRIILAEGDSWFMFPWFVTDIIDWLNRFGKDEFAIYSMAYGGDWITNIIYEGTYIEELSTLTPEFFLISGGGNDLVGNYKLAVMVDKTAKLSYTDTNRPHGYKGAEEFITKEFFAFVLAIKLQYYLMFRSIHDSNKLSKTTIITQGYDYAVPTFKWHWSLRYPLQWVINSFADSGKWLKRPLCIKGIPDEHHSNIIRLLIDKINEMFIELAKRRDKQGNYEFPNLYHIDCRGVAQKPCDWFDELHLKSHVFKSVAEGYKVLMNRITLASQNPLLPAVPKVMIIK